jgi:hypothetical protein
MKRQDWNGQTSMDVFVPNDLQSYREIIMEKLRSQPKNRVVVPRRNKTIGELQAEAMSCFGLNDIELFLKAVNSLKKEGLLFLWWSTSLQEFHEPVAKIALTKKFALTLKVAITE